MVELLDQLRELIYAQYLQQIQDHLRADRQNITRTPCEDDPSFWVSHSRYGPEATIRR